MSSCLFPAGPTRSSSAGDPTRAHGAAVRLAQANEIVPRTHRETEGAVGRPAGGTCRRRQSLSLASDHIDPRRRREREQVRRQWDIALGVRKAQLRDLIELVGEEHGPQFTLVETDPHELKIGVRVLGNELEPLETPAWAQDRDVEL